MTDTVNEVQKRDAYAPVLEAVEKIETKLTSKLEAEVSKLKDAQLEEVGKLEAKLASISSVKEVSKPKSNGELLIETVRKMAKSKGTQSEKITLEEAAGLQGSGTGAGGHVGYDPVFWALRYGNPLRQLSRIVTWTSSDYQFTAKVGNAGATWGYPVANNTAATTVGTTIWNVQLLDINTQFPIRTAAIDDINGLENAITEDAMIEFSATEATSMIQGTAATEIKGIDTYTAAATAAYATSGSQNHTIKGITVANKAAFNHQTVVNLIYGLPIQYRGPGASFMASTDALQTIRGLQDTNGRPIYIDSPNADGVIGKLMGFPIIENPYMDAFGAAGRPLYFANWERFHTIVDYNELTIKKYDQTQPGFVTWYFEKRVNASIRDPFAGIALTSTA